MATNPELLKLCEFVWYDYNDGYPIPQGFRVLDRIWGTSSENGIVLGLSQKKFEEWFYSTQHDSIEHTQIESDLSSCIKELLAPVEGTYGCNAKPLTQDNHPENVGGFENSPNSS